MPTPNPLLLGIETPPIMAAHEAGRRYDGRLGPSLDLCQAVPGWAPHPELLARLGHAALDPACAKYGPIQGDLALREALGLELARTHGADVAADEIAITAGCNQAFFLTMLSIAQRGDNVILPAPWFWNHQQTCAMLGIEPRALPCRAEAGFVPDPEEAERLVDAGTRAIVLITPNNPTGAVYSPETIARFHALCVRRGLTLVLDETYADFLPEGQARAHDLFTQPDWAGHLVRLYSFSKAYCVPGHRLGAVVAEAGLVREFVKALDCLHICPGRPIQAALSWAIPALQSWREANRAMVNGRVAAMRTALGAAPGWALESIGAYFAYVRHPFPNRGAASVAEWLASERGAVGLPGNAFGPGQDGHLRIAFANLDAAGIEALPARLSASPIASMAPQRSPLGDRVSMLT